MFSIDVRFNIEARSVEDAYRRLFRKLSKVDTRAFSWESLNTWFNENGDEIPDQVIDRVVTRVIEGEEGYDG